MSNISWGFTAEPQIVFSPGGDAPFIARLDADGYSLPTGRERAIAIALLRYALERLEDE